MEIPVKVYYDRFFLFALLNLPNALISIAIFLPRVLMYQKHQINKVLFSSPHETGGVMLSCPPIAL